ncbi:hypothetical protein GYB22_10835 [bacterium]|nr:hypothetical protein [bacterium]
MSTSRIITIVFYAIIVACIAYGVFYLLWFGENFFKGTSFSIGLTITLFAVAIVAAIVGALGGLIYQPKSAIKSVVGIVVMLILAGIGYSLSAGEITDKYIEFGVTEIGSSKMVDAGLYIMYGSIAIAIVSIIAAEVSAIFKS